MLIKWMQLTENQIADDFILILFSGKHGIIMSNILEHIITM